MLRDIQTERHPEWPAGQGFEPLRHDPHDRVHRAAQTDRAPDDGRITVKLPLPDGVPDHHDWRGVRPLVFGRQGAPEKRRDSRELECRRRDLRYA